MRRTTFLAVLVAFAPALAQAGTIPIYTEAFTGSTLNGATVAPTATTTGYQILSTKNTAASALGSTLDVSQAATSSGITGVQALFASTPVTLAAGDCIELVVTFQGTNLMVGTAGDGLSRSINFGLYNSGGAPPVPNGPFAMGTTTNNPTGNAQNWEGYVGRVGTPDGNNSEIYTRDPQDGADDESQDVLFNNAGTGAYDAPGGTSLGGGVQTSLADATDYTASLLISYDGTDVKVDQNLYLGTAASGTPIYSNSGTQTGGYTTYDALSFGYRSDSGSAITMSVSDLEVRAGQMIPEPGSLALIGLSGLGLLVRRRRV